MNKNYSWDVFWVERGCLSWIRAALPSVRLGVTQPLVMSPRIDSNNAINRFSIDSRISRLNSFQTLVWYCYWMEGDRLDLIRGLVARYLFSSFFFGIFWYIQRKFSASFLSLLMFSFSAQESSLSVGNNTWSSRHKGDMLMWGGDHHCDHHCHHQNLRNHENEQYVKTLGVVERVSPAWSSVVHASKIAKRTKVLIIMIMSMRMISSSFWGGISEMKKQIFAWAVDNLLNEQTKESKKKILQSIYFYHLECLTSVLPCY